MTTAQEFSSGFRHVRLLLARTKGFPEGDANIGYDLLVPLTPDGHLDANEWRVHRSHCRVRAFCEGVQDKIGELRRMPGGQWYFEYNEDQQDDEFGFRFNDERFTLGEYVSLRHGNEMRTYRVALVERP